MQNSKIVYPLPSHPHNHHVKLIFCFSLQIASVFLSYTMILILLHSLQKVSQTIFGWTSFSIKICKDCNIYSIHLKL